MVQNFPIDCTGVENDKPVHSQFCPQNLKMVDFPEFLFALEIIFSDSEFIIDELMVDDDDIIVLNAIGRCYQLHGNYRAVLFAG